MTDRLPDRLLSNEAQRIQALVERLFAEAPKLEHPDGTPRADQAPAIECVVMLKAGGQVEGALSITPEGLLRMLAPMADPKTRQLVAMIEHHFDYEQVADLAMIRRVTTESKPASPIIHTS